MVLDENYISTVDQIKSLENFREKLLLLKRKILEHNNCKSYQELKNEEHKYIYRKITSNLRYINKIQDKIKNILNEAGDHFESQIVNKLEHLYNKKPNP